MEKQSDNKAFKSNLSRENREDQTYEEGFKLLSEIGKAITTSFSIEKIINTVYHNVNKLMDANVFAIGIFNKSENRLDFPCIMEKGETLSFQFDSLTEKKRLSIVCYTRNEEIFINDLVKEYNNFFPNEKLYEPKEGDLPHSLIYLPLKSVEGDSIGVITVQSFQTNAYRKYHLSILKNIAVITSIALENAILYKEMEGKVNQRTEEILKQKEEIENTYLNFKLLSEIGQQITCCLTVERVIETAYHNINQLMDASSFWIGVYNEKNQRLEYPMGIERGEVYGSPYYNLSDKKWLPVNSFLSQREIFVNDYIAEYNNYIPDASPPLPVAGDRPVSSIWYPLKSKENKPLGILTIQSFSKNAYTQYHLNIVRNLAVFTSIALENAILYEEVEKKVQERTVEVVRQKEALENQTIQLEEKNKEVTDSITYARRIQRALLTGEKYIQKYIHEFFILYQPKDIVSGDFYWAVNHKEKFYMVTADCTGHGVPGAFMSMLGVNFLNEIIIERNILEPDMILNKLREEIIRALNQEGSGPAGIDSSNDIKDGMDCVIAVYDFHKMELQYAAANNEFYIIRDRKLLIFNPDKMPVGKFHEDELPPFSLQKIPIKKGDLVYTFTDGFADQFGGKSGKKFKYRQFQDLLLSNSHKPISGQKMFLEETMNKWKEGYKQVDDILVIGVRV